RVVKGTRFVDLRDAGDPVGLAARYDHEGADELVFLDITASAERRRTTVDLAARVAAALSIPFCVGGGIDSVDEAAAILRAGADKVAINTAAVRRPELLGEIARRAGAQAAVLAIDARRRVDGSYEVVIEGGRTPTGLDAVEWACRGVERGAGEILLTSMGRDGHGADARVHGQGSARRDPAYQRGALPQPLAGSPLEEGRDERQRHAPRRACARLRCGRPFGEGAPRRPGLPHRRGDLLRPG